MKYTFVVCVAAIGFFLGSTLLPSDFLAERKAHFSFLTRKSVEQAAEHRHLKSIDLVGGTGTPPSNRLPLQECEGDCDKDRDVSTKS